MSEPTLQDMIRDVQNNLINLSHSFDEFSAKINELSGIVGEFEEGAKNDEPQTKEMKDEDKTVRMATMEFLREVVFPEDRCQYLTVFAEIPNIGDEDLTKTEVCGRPVRVRTYLSDWEYDESLNKITNACNIAFTSDSAHHENVHYFAIMDSSLKYKGKVLATGHFVRGINPASLFVGHGNALIHVDRLKNYHGVDIPKVW
jgi:hypothetical protein